MMNKYNLIAAGAGPVDQATSLYAVRRGLKVVLLERRGVLSPLKQAGCNG
ncbi:MAG: hypothetical protein GY868_10380 [Deltaproteobacteria bacterium]|nr:hypothetical protein [Deltaproteobacteria bacterium]